MNPNNLNRRLLATRPRSSVARPFGALPGDPGTQGWTPAIAAKRANADRAAPWTLLGQLFPEAPPGPSAAGSRAAAAAALLVALAVGTILTLLRQQGVAATNSIWAEDGSKFLTQAALAGPWHAILEPVGGFLNLWPRLLAALTVEVSGPPGAAAWVAVTAALTSTACGLVVYVASAGHVRSRLLRGLLAFAVVLPAVGNGQIANDWNNLHWYFVIAELWVLLWRPRSTTARVLAGVVALVATATDPTALLLFPLVVARPFTVRDWREQAQVGGWAVGAVAQVAVVVSGLGGAGKLFLPTFGALVSSWSIRVGVGGIIGPVLTAGLWQGIGWAGPALGVTALAALAGAALAAPGRHRLLISCLVLASFGWYAVTYLVRLEAAFLPSSADLAEGVRYAAVPTWLLVSAMVLALDRLAAGWGNTSPEGPVPVHRPWEPAESWRGPAAWRGDAGASTACVVATIAAVGLVLASVLTSYSATVNSRQDGPSWSSTVASAASSCALGADLSGASLEVVKVETAPLIEPVPVWYVEVPCRNGKLAWR